MAKPVSEQFVCTIDRVENGRYVLDFGKGQQLVVAKKFLPRGAKSGDVLRVELMTDRLAKKRQENLARALLEEILNVGR